MGAGTSGAVVITHSGGCHCGRVRFEVQAPAEIEVLDCNCSICTKTGYLHLIVPAAQFRLLTDAAALTNYQFNTGHRAPSVLFSVRHQIILRAALASRRLQRQRALSR